jgi:hypothetical protein
MKTKLPAIQAEQVADDVAPGTAEYVPTNASDEKYAHADSNTSVKVDTREEEGENMGAGTRYTVNIRVSKWYKGVGSPQGKTCERGVGKARTCNQSSQSMAPAGHEVTAEEPAGQ